MMLSFKDPRNESGNKKKVLEHFVSQSKAAGSLLVAFATHASPQDLQVSNCAFFTRLMARDPTNQSV
jgi:hypothetical protein